MTKEDFAFWEKAFLAAMQLATEGVDHRNPSFSFDHWAHNRGLYADAALAVWREKRRELVTVDLHAQRVRDDRSIAEGMDNGALQP